MNNISIAKSSRETKKLSLVKPQVKVAKEKEAKPVARKVNKKRTVTSDQRWAMIAIAAYYLAEKRGFAEESSVGDWLEAEREIDHQLLSQ